MTASSDPNTWEVPWILMSMWVMLVAAVLLESSLFTRMAISARWVSIQAHPIALQLMSWGPMRKASKQASNIKLSRALVPVFRMDSTDPAQATLSTLRSLTQYKPNSFRTRTITSHLFKRHSNKMEPQFLWSWRISSVICLIILMSKSTCKWPSARTLSMSTLPIILLMTHAHRSATQVAPKSVVSDGPKIPIDQWWRGLLMKGWKEPNFIDLLLLLLNYQNLIRILN